MIVAIVRPHGNRAAPSRLPGAHDAPLTPSIPSGAARAAHLIALPPGRCCVRCFAAAELPVQSGRLRSSPQAKRTRSGLWQHPPYFHDGSAATLDAVVAHYDRVLGLGLSERQRADLVEYLRTL
jgi:hypothetical protein